MLEMWIRDYLIGKQELHDCLAFYNGEPAVFYQESPWPEDSLWDQTLHYPQLVYRIVYEEAEQGYRTGRVKVRVLGTEGSQLLEVQEILKKELEHLIISEQGAVPIYLNWSKMKALKQREKRDLEFGTMGNTLHFQFRELPAQENLNPDAVQALAQHLKKGMPDALQLDYGKKDEVYQIEIEHPVFYIRIAEMKAEEETHTVVWMEGKLSIHVLAASPDIRTKWMMLLVHQLSSEGEIEMLDHSPMWIKEVLLDGNVDYRKEGQVTVSVRYGVPKYESKKLILDNIHINNR